MTAVQDIPEEVLKVIFNKVELQDLHQCQYVCRSWYQPAHVLLLSVVQFFSVERIMQFVKCIDYNPCSAYLNAVKMIKIYSSVTKQHISKDIIRKLILRFPNIKVIVIDSEWFSTRLINDIGIQNNLSKCCPHLETFTVQVNKDSQAIYYDLLYKMRHSITSLHLSNNMTIPVENLQDYITSFPRLESLLSADGYPDTFGKCLPLIEKLPELNYLAVGRGKEQDQGNFMETYLARRSKSEQDAIVRRLSQVCHVAWFNSIVFSVYSAKFISRYLTGLTSFTFTGGWGLQWTDTMVETFCTNILDTACSMEESRIIFQQINLDILMKCFESIIGKVLFQIPPKKEKLHGTLRLKVFNNDDEQGSTPVSLEARVFQRFKRSVEISLYNQVTVSVISQLFKSIPSLNEIDKFIIDIFETSEWNQDTNLSHIHMLDSILHCTQSIRELVLDIPTMFDHKFHTDSATQVSALILRAHPDVNQEVFKSFMNMFHGLKHLHTFYFCGVWDDDNAEYLLLLQDQNLQELTIDITPLILSFEGSFILLQVESVHDNVRHFYKVSLDLQTVTRIDSVYLQNYQPIEDYLTVHILITSVKSLYVFKYNDFDNGEEMYYSEWGSKDMIVTNVFDNNK